MQSLIGFEGRLSRRQWLRYGRRSVMFIIPAFLVAFAIGVGLARWGLETWSPAPMGLVLVILAVSGVSQNVRRLHDRGLSGWMIPGSLLADFAILGGGLWASSSLPEPWAGLVFWSMFIFLVGIAAWTGAQLYMRGSAGPNRYGPPPPA